MFAPATFSLFVRDLPPNRGYFVSAGLEDVLDYLLRIRYVQEDLDFLNSTGLFSDDFLHYLSNLRFTGEVHAIPEGRVFFKDEPVLEVTAPIIEGQLMESYIINTINLQVSLASKVARCVYAAGGRKQVFRQTNGGRFFSKDLIALRDEKIEGEPLLEAVMQHGERLRPAPSLDAMHECFQKDFNTLDDSIKALENPTAYPVDLAPGLEELQTKVVHAVIEKELGES